MADIQERTLEFACEIIKLYELLMKRRGVGRTLARQLLRAGTSIGANLQEADAGEIVAILTTIVRNARGSNSSS